MLLIAILVALLVLDLLLFTFWDKYIVSFLLLVGIVVGAFWFVPAVTQFVHDVGFFKLLTIWLPSYLLAGCVFAALKWILHLLKVGSSVRDLYTDFKRKIEDIRKDPDHYLSYHSLPAADLQNDNKVFLAFVAQNSTVEDDWRLREVISDNGVDRRKVETQDQLIEALVPQAKKNVGRITFWALQWPIAAVSTIIEDILIKLGKRLSQLFDYLLNRMARKIIARAFQV